MISTKYWSHLLFAAFVGIAYVGLSVAFIMSNKWLLIDKGKFPHPEALTVLQLVTTAVLSWVLYFFRPTMFTAMQSLELTKDLSWRFIPLALAFAGSMVASNVALSLSPVSVLQVMKQGNVVLIFVGSLALGLEKFGKASTALVMLILLGVAICIVSEPATIGLVGIAIQLGSQLCEVGKVLMQSVLMSKMGHRLDPLSMALFLAPMSALFACAIFLGQSFWDGNLGIVYSSFLSAWPWLLSNVVVSFGLNVVVAWTVWSFNPTGFLIAGVMKDVSIMLAASMIFGEALTRMQCAGFSIALIGISLYGSYKIQKGAQIRGPQTRNSFTATKAEKQPLLKHETP